MAVDVGVNSGNTEGAIAVGANASHSWTATAAYLWPSPEALNVARRQRVVTGSNFTSANAPIVVG